MGELLSAIQQERQLISCVDQIWRFIQRAPSEERYVEIGGLQQGTVELDPQPCGERCQLLIVGMVYVIQLRIFTRDYTQN